MDLAAIPWADILPFILIGFLAQLVDSSLGLAFGMLSNGLLILLGVPPAAAVATTRSVESFTAGASGIAHIFQRNVDWPLFARLVIPGIIGGLLGFWLLLLVGDDVLRPILLIYLVAIGVYLLWRAPRRPQTFRRIRMVAPVGLFGGLFDASGAGGWGPLVTGNLLAQGMTPRMAIGTTNAAEFFVTVTLLAAFVGTMGSASFTIMATGLLTGALIAAPLGAWLTRRLAPLLLLRLVGAALIVAGTLGFASLMLAGRSIFPSW